MSQQYFPEDEWATLLQTPTMIIMAMTLADKTDPVSFLQETQAAVQIVANEQNRADLTSDLAKSLTNSLKEIDAKDPLQGEQLLLKKQFELLGALQNLKNASEGRKNTLAHFKQVGLILGNKVTAVQAQEFKTWILSIARQIAEAVKEGGLFGVGGERVSRDESEMLKAIEKALDVKF
jgi:hypothetical protein